MRTIESPGVEIREIDLSSNAQLPVGTSVFAIGYAKQGPTDELLNITSNSDLVNIYGEPTNAAERYFHHTCKQVLAANGNLLTTRLPYGSGAGTGYTTNYSALMFPVFSFDDAGTGGTITSEVSVGGNLPGEFSSILPSVTGLSIGSTFNFYQQLSGNSYVGYDVTTLILSGFLEGPNEDVIINYDVATGTLTSTDTDYTGTWTLLDNDFDQYRWNVTTVGAGITGGNLTLLASVCGATAATHPTLKNSDNYYFGQPSHLIINDATYNNWIQGGISWSNTINPITLSGSQFAQATAAPNAGFILINELKSTIDEKFAGYYYAIADNSKVDKGSDYDVVQNVRTFNDTTAGHQWITVNPTRLAFNLTGTLVSNQGSTSEIVETVPDWDFADTGAGGFSDSIILTQFRLRRSIYNADESVLDQLLAESYIGSFDASRTINNQQGGAPLNFYIEDVVNSRSTSMKMLVNPNISKYSGVWSDSTTGQPLKKIRIAASARANTNSSIISDPAEPHGKPQTVYSLTNSSSFVSNGDNLYGSGEYVVCTSETEKQIGNLPSKVERALVLVDNRDFVRIDIVPEAGLGTIWTGMTLDMTNWPAGATNRSTFSQTRQIFDDEVFIAGIQDSHIFDTDSDGLLDQVTGTSSEASDLYETVYNLFNNFVQYTRKDCVYIADPLRYIFVQGTGEIKVLDDRNKNFSQHIFWPLKNLFASANSSYSGTYSNWLKINDATSNKFVWAPPSGWIARLMINTDVNFFPWFAPAGLTRGILNDVLDIGINPNQKQRDLLYKNGINPIVFFPTDGYIVWGQKTLQKKHSALDRWNVRRLFLWLEKGVLQVARTFVFELNTVFTRSRFKAAVSPILDFARDNEGIYDYLVVCDERNNDSATIDRNEMVMDIYIKPTRTAEYILINFIATRTDQDFNELI